VTGTAGSGKSTLIDRMTAALRVRQKKIGILMVDPTSPFTGGAFLGDRLRMRDHFLDDGVFIRSVATRGGWGGVSTSIREAIHLLDAMGKEVVFVETIGAGQDQVEIASVAHTVLVVLGPGTGDEIQGMKAGLLEAADILVVNKGDLSGAEELFQQLRTLFDESKLPILKTSALKNEGIALLTGELESHRRGLLASGDHQRKNTSFSRRQILGLVQERLMARFLGRVDQESMESLVERVAGREVDPYTAADEILEKKGL
jgi:LAO/AO transport system kinase